MSCLLVYFLSDCLLTLGSRSVSVVDFQMFNKLSFFFFSVCHLIQKLSVSELPWHGDEIIGEVE